MGGSVVFSGYLWNCIGFYSGWSLRMDKADIKKVVTELYKYWVGETKGN